MTNLIILPILLPLIAGTLFVFWRKRLPFVRTGAQIVSIMNLLLTTFIMYKVIQDGTIILETGGWIAPYGIILVGDLLSVSLLVATNIIAVAAAFYAPYTLDQGREEHYFYTFFLMLIAGVSGAFLTGDIFNLFVFFEVLLMASYGMIVLGGTRQQLRESIKYVLLNLFSSILFVTTVSFLYSVTGTVNMAQLSERVGQVNQDGILTTIAILFFVVFATKGALFPLYFWMPHAYAKPPAVISALFGALLTKVGIYSILRVFTLIFNGNVDYTHTFFIILAGFTLIFGVVGAMSTNNIKLIIAYNIIPAIGFMIMGVGIFTEGSLAGSVYYLLHDMIIKGALFMLVGAVAIVAGTSDLRKISGLIKQYPLLGWLFFIATLTLAGLPPFSGFIGKLLLLKGAFENGHYVIGAVGLITSLLILVSVMRIFLNGFWGESMTLPTKTRSIRPLYFPITFLLIFSVVLGIGAEWFLPHIQQIGVDLMDPSIYVDTILKE
ncbi:Na+/H+ antiporter subunit D [Pseudalkalibacillus berkeleyi]|uniref:Na+/H+ antiporter subunit D n=1 Tax=Pseudalkalibacillus berkeleyi TaxID=1069813 RepID=A0ABS9H2E7_9BACL|nr:Na+/H+ antiporter subunit D [Pseudalkalibacillus berkeleyi]MCF6138005.1 Na+/H+ antiporter subunit D [Pseudalkalibacillus berkeleyi]